MSEAQKKILKLLEDGKISATEATELLQALQSNGGGSSTHKTRRKEFKVEIEGEDFDKDRAREDAERHREEAEKIRDKTLNGIFAFASEIPKIVKHSMKFSHGHSELQKTEFKGKDSVEVKLVSGDLKIETSEGESVVVECESVLPIDKELDEQDKNLRLSFTYGDVRLKVPRGLEILKLNIVSGDIDVSCEVKELQVSALSGDARFLLADFETVNISSKSGDCLLEIPDYEDLSINARTMTGSVNATGIDDFDKKKDNVVKYNADLESGHRVRINSLTGDVLIKVNKE